MASSSSSHNTVTHVASETKRSPRNGGIMNPSNAAIAVAMELLSSSGFHSTSTSSGSGTMNSWPEAMQPPIGYEHFGVSKTDEINDESEGSNKRKNIRLGNNGRAKLRRKISSMVKESNDVKKARQEIGLVRSATVEQLVGMADRLGLSEYVDEVIEEQEQCKLNKPKKSKKIHSVGSQWYDQSSGSMSSSGFSTSVGSSFSSQGTRNSIGSTTVTSNRTSQQVQLGNRGRSLLRQRISALTRENSELKKICREISAIRSATVQQLVAMADAVGLNDYVNLLVDDYDDSKKSGKQRSVQRRTASDSG